MRKCDEHECTSIAVGEDEFGRPGDRHDELCYYHRKVKARLMSVGLSRGERLVGTYDDYLRRFPDPHDVSTVRHTVLESGVIDTEQEQLADVLKSLGADQSYIKNALTRTERKRRQRRRKLLKQASGASR